MSDAKPEAGLASGILNPAGRVGGALDWPSSPRLAAAQGYHVAWLVSAVIALVSIAIAAAMLRPAAQSPEALVEAAA